MLNKEKHLTQEKHADQSTDQLVSYRSMIREAYRRAKAKSPAYSQRLFAQKLGMSPAALSRVLKGEKGISSTLALLIAQKLELSKQETENFVLLVQYEGAKKPSIKRLLLDRIQSKTSTQKIFDLELDRFELISDWENVAVLESLQIVHLGGDPKKIAQHLGLSKVDVASVLDRLERLGLVIRNSEKNTFQKTNDILRIQSQNRSAAITEYYRQVTEKSLETLNTQDPETRVSGAQCFALDPNQIEQARKLTFEYLDSLQRLADQGKSRTEVYQAVAHLFKFNPKPPHQESI